MEITKKEWKKLKEDYVGLMFLCPFFVFGLIWVVIKALIKTQKD